MTSAPVKDVGSLMNYVGNTGIRGTGASNMGAGGMQSFGDVMSKTGGGRNDAGKPEGVKAPSRKEPVEVKEDSSFKTKEVSRTEDSANAEKVSQKVNGNTDEAEGNNEILEKAGEKLVEETAKKLGVSEEEVLKAMEQLGFDLTALLNPENLTQLAVTLSGEESSVALLTNEGLYGTVQELLQSLNDVKAALSKELSLDPEQLQQMIEEAGVKNQMPEEGLMEVPEEGKPGQEVKDGKENEAKITVTVDHGTKNVKLTTDEAGNVKQVEGIADKEKTDADSGAGNGKESAGGRESKEGNPNVGGLQENLFQNKAQGVNAEIPFEQAVHSTQDTQEIMNQIMDYMKVQLKPGMDQLEMQLHPESLGNVHIQITSKGGEVTAQFHVQNEAVKAAIESQLMELKDTLKEQGIKVEAVEVAVESQAFESNLWQGKGRDDNSSYQGNKKSPRRINLDALDEGFEEEAGEEELLAAKIMEANGNTVDYTA